MLSEQSDLSICFTLTLQRFVRLFNSTIFLKNNIWVLYPFGSFLLIQIWAKSLNCILVFPLKLKAMNCVLVFLLELEAMNCVLVFPLELEAINCVLVFLLELKAMPAAPKEKFVSDRPVASFPFLCHHAITLPLTIRLTQKIAINNNNNTKQCHFSLSTNRQTSC